MVIGFYLPTTEGKLMLTWPSEHTLTKGYKFYTVQLTGAQLRT